MSYLLSGLDLVVNNTTSIVINTNPITIQGDIATSENIIAVNNNYNQFSVPDNAAAATIKSTSKAASLTGLTAKALGITKVPILTTVEGNGLKDLSTSYYEGITYSPQLLTCVGVNGTSTTIGDLSTSNFTITNNGAATVSTFGPFLLSSFAYDSVLFNGTTQSLTTTVTTSSPLDLATGAGNWTIEGWFYVTSIAAGGKSVLWKTAPTNPSYAFWINAATPQWIIGDGVGGANTFNLAVITANTWYHFALVRAGNTLTPYMNGVAQTAQTITTTMGNGAASALLYIGAASDGRYFPGYISNVRIVKGAALYRGNFLPPTQNFSADSITNITTKVNATTATTTKLTYEPLDIKLYNSLKYSAPTGQQETYDPDLVGNSRINSYLVGNLSNKHIKSDTEIVNVSLYPEFYINGPDAPNILSTEGRGEITTQITGALVFNNNLSAISYAGNPGAFNITADFTLEFWIKPTGWGQNVYQRVMGNYQVFGTGWDIRRVDQSITYRNLTVFFSDFGQFVTTGEVDNDVWQHWALVRSGSALSWWKNGALDSTTTMTRASNLDITDFTSPFTIGRGQVGNIENVQSAAFEITNLRITKGTALYSSTFTPQVPLSAVANTTFLLPVADSATQLLETVSGSTLTSNSVQFTNLGPAINTTTTLITPVRGGGSFNGTSQYLTASIGSSPLTAGDFTVEAWFYKSAATTNSPLSNVVSGDPYFWAISTYADGHWQFQINDGTSIAITGSILTSINTWIHIAATRQSGLVKLFVNGVLDNSATITKTITANPTLIGSFRGLNYFTGYISNVRITSVAVYTGNFTVPTKPLTKEQNASTNIQAILATQTSLLTLQDPLTLVDNSSVVNTITNNNGVIIGSTYSPIWTPYAAAVATTSAAGSLSFNGTSQYLTIPDNTALQMGAGDFTVEFWINFSSITGYQTPFDKGYGGVNSLVFQTGNSTGRLIIYSAGVALITETGTEATGAWIHYALVRTGTVLTLYRNGVSSGSTTNSTNFNNTAQIGLGAAGTAPGGGAIGDFKVAGYITNVRIVKGTAMYTANFTPTVPLTAVTNTQLLLLVGSDANKTVDSSTNNFTVTNIGGVTYSSTIVPSATTTQTNYSPGAYVSTPPINTTNIEYINYRTDPRSVNKRVKNLIVGTTGVLEELQSWS